MDLPNIHGISDIQQTQIMSGSRTTLPISPRSNFLSGELSLDKYFHHQQDLANYVGHSDANNPSFSELRDYVQKTLSSWGYKLGYLTQNSQNSLIIGCFMQLIQQRYKDQESRQNQKKLLTQAQFERNKYHSLLEQERSNAVQKNKTIGRLQNSINDYKMRLKNLQQSSKKEKEEDKKMISMLKSKNEQIMHEMKKKQQQTNRIKQQMKKNVGQKSVLKNVSFEVYEIFPKQPNDEIKDKLQSLTQRYENEKKNIMRENQLLREKLFDIREQIVSFAQWVDINLFRQHKPNYKNKLVINHNLLFKKQSLVVELNQILNNARSGMAQIIRLYEEGRKSLVSGRSSFKKLDNQQSNDAKNLEQNLSPNKIGKKGNEFIKKPQESAVGSVKRLSINQETRQKYQMPTLQLKKQAKTLQPNFEVKDEQSELSMISHMSANEIVAENQKWDLLFENDQ